MFDISPDTNTSKNLKRYIIFFFFCKIALSYCISFRVGIEHTTGESMNAYLAATVSKPAPVKEEPAAPAASLPAIAGSDSDSDSN